MECVVRVAAKELTSLILDEERLRAERSDRKTWKSRVTGIEEFASEGPTVPAQRRQRPRRQSGDDEEDAEYKLALEASKYQEEEDRRRREGRQGVEEDDDDLAKAIKLSKEEDERRRRELEESNASSLFDDAPTTSTAPQPTGMNMGYQQGSNVDWLGNPIDQNQMMQAQPTGYMNNAYTGYPTNGYANGYNNGFNPQQTGMYDPYGQQQNNTLQPQPQPFQMQATGYNPYAQQQPQFQQPQPTASPEPTVPSGSNNPWASNNGNQAQSLKPMPTGSNNPFASGFSRPQSSRAPAIPTLSSLQSLPEQKSLQAFSPSPQPQSQPSFSQPQPSYNQTQQPQKQLSEHEQRLNALLASGEGMDTFGNTGELRIPAQHTAPGTFVNSAGVGANKLTAEATGNNPFLRQQFTGMPTVSYGSQQQMQVPQMPQMPAATGPAGMNGYGGGSNPFASRPQQQNNNQGQDLIQF